MSFFSISMVKFNNIDILKIVYPFMLIINLLILKILFIFCLNYNVIVNIFILRQKLYVNLSLFFCSNVGLIHSLLILF